DYVHALVHVPSDDLIQSGLIEMRSGLNEMYVPTALADADNGHFLVPLFRVRSFGANVGFVNLYSALQFVSVCFGHGFTDAMAQVPRRLVADSERALQLVGAHALAALVEQVCAEKPLPQRQVRVVEDRARRDAELVI